MVEEFRLPVSSIVTDILRGQHVDRKAKTNAKSKIAAKEVKNSPEKLSGKKFTGSNGAYANFGYYRKH